MGNGALYMCYWCESDISNSSYFINDDGWKEVCPECHHYHLYGTPEQLKEYKKKRGIKL